MNNQCDNCPVVDCDKPCMAVLAPDEFGYYCEWAKTDDEMKRRIIVGRSAYGVTRVKVPANPARPGLPASVSIDLIKRMKACQFWQASSSCGCGVNLCLAGKGKDGQVTHQDCFVCLLAQRV